MGFGVRNNNDSFSNAQVLNSTTELETFTSNSGKKKALLIGLNYQ